MDQLKGDADEALETLRDLARGIYPPLLADKGLAVALGSQARKATVPVTVEADGVGRYSQDVEATVYFCVLEAMQNVQKYAGATNVTVRLCADAGTLMFTVTDDGAGFDLTIAKKGAGLTNMADRIDALGGTWSSHRAPEQGPRFAARCRPWLVTQSRFDAPPTGRCSSPRFEQPVGAELRLRDEPGRARLGRTWSVLVSLVRRKHEDDHGPSIVDPARISRVASSPLMPGRFTSISTRSGCSSRAEADGVLAGLHLANHLEPVGELDDRSGDIAERRLVIDDQHPDAHVRSPMLQRYPGRIAAATMHASLAG